MALNVSEKMLLALSSPPTSSSFQRMSPPAEIVAVADVPSLVVITPKEENYCLITRPRRRRLLCALVLRGGTFFYDVRLRHAQGGKGFLLFSPIVRRRSGRSHRPFFCFRCVLRSTFGSGYRVRLVSIAVSGLAGLFFKPSCGCSAGRRRGRRGRCRRPRAWPSLFQKFAFTLTDK